MHCFHRTARRFRVRVPHGYSGSVGRSDRVRESIADRDAAARSTGCGF